METIAIKEIDLSNYAPEDLEFCFPRGAQMTIETDGSISIEVQGHNAMSDTFYTMPIIDALTYDIITTINGIGLYNVDITSVSSVKMLLTGSSTGKIYVKVIGG